MSGSFWLERRRDSWGGEGTDLDLDRAQVGQCGGDGRSEVEREGLAQVAEGFFFCLALADHVNVEALGDIPVALCVMLAVNVRFITRAPLVAVEW